MRRVLLLVFLVGCIRESATTCPDQTVCPGGTECTLIREQYYCISPDRIGCEGASSTCDLPGGSLGTCHEGICFPNICGNGLVDNGENCDDGNQLPDDGCSADCRSSEVCGNGVIDSHLGELCDDGGATSHDRCASDCSLEVASWQRITNGWPLARAEHVMAYDAARGRTVLYGGANMQPGNFVTGDEVSEFDGTGWATRTELFPPGGRLGSAMVYDRELGRVVLFGGNAFGVLLADTWTWDGDHWRPLAPVQTPSSRSNHAMAYDPVRKRTVMFGGAQGNDLLGDTWELDRNTWTRIDTPTSPPPLRSAMMTFDPGRARIVLFGGSTDTNIFTDEAWSFDGTTWTRIESVNKPVGRNGGVFGPDLVNRRLILHGGYSGPSLLTDTWALDASGWTQLADAGTPPPRHLAASALDRNGRLIFFGGRELANGSERNDTWTWDGAKWVELPYASDTAQSRGGGVLDLHRARIVTFGGGNPSGDATTLTRELYENHWTTVATPTSPSARSFAGLAYDRARRESLLFGGFSTTLTPSADGTWAYDGTTWVQRATGAASPPPRFRHGIVYDADRNETVVFGGSSTFSQDSMGDTWIWNGETWRNALPASSPSPRIGAAMGYNERTKRVYLFGGSPTGGSTERLDDLWEWDGTTWREIAFPFGPSPRRAAAFAWDRARQRLVLVGGSSGLELRDSWEWDGIAWTRVETLLPAGRSEHILVSSPSGAGVEMIGGLGNDAAAYLSRFLLRWDGELTEESCRVGVDLDGDGLTGCNDPDCWIRCTPLCPPNTTCDPAAPRCGDGTCDALDDCAICPEDCGTCPALCGDGLCSDGESCVSDC